MSIQKKSIMKLKKKSRGESLMDKNSVPVSRIEQCLPLDSILSTLARHPFIALAIMCLASACVFGSSTDVRLSQLSILSMFAIFVITAFLVVYFGLKKYFKSELTKTYAFFVSIMSGLTVVIFTADKEENVIAVFIIAVILVVGLFMMWCWQGSINTQRFAALVIFLGFALRLTYILYTTIYERQHDNGIIGQTEGHLGYITQFWNELFALPEGDVRLHNQYYHPPLHHFIVGIILNLLKALGFTDIALVGEYIQYITMFYSCCCMVIMYKILSFFKIDGVALIVGLSIVAFHPTFYIMGGSVNNDMLSITFMAAAVLNTLYYYKNRTYVNIIKIAICVGCGMMSKLSGWMVAPAIAVVFIVVLVQSRKQWFNIIKQWLAFGAVCVPLGLWWSVRNFIMFRVPFNYVLDFGKQIDMYVGDRTFLERLTDFSAFQFESVYDQYVWYNCPYYEYNPTIGLFKTAVFDEAQYTSGLDFWAVLLFWVNVVLALIAVVAMIYMLIKSTGILDRVMKVFLFLIYIVPTVSYYIFCDSFPYTCTMNIRYVVITIFTGALFFAMALQTIKEQYNLKVNVLDANENEAFVAAKPNMVCKALYTFAIILTMIFCIASIVTYIMIGYIPALYDGILH